MPLLYALPFLLAASSEHALRLVRPGDGFRVPDAPLLNPVDALTIEARVRPEPDDSAGPFHFIVSKNYGGRGYALLLIGRGDAYRLQFEANGLVNYPIPMTVLRSGWWHVAGVARAGKPLELYVNGIKVAEAPSSAPLTVSPMPLCVGTSPWDSLVGGLDEVRIWGVARTQEELVASSSRRLSGREPGLIAYWDFEKMPAGAVVDRTGHTPSVKVSARRVRISGRE